MHYTREEQILLARLLQKPREWLISHPDVKLTPTLVRKFRALKKRLSQSEPLAHLVSHKEFYGLDFLVNNKVLIPRPETEQIIDNVLDTLRVTDYGLRVTIVDIGTGSGCIAITLAKLIPHARITAADISPAALQIARKNARQHGVTQRIKFIRADLLPKNVKPNVIVSNPPYLTTAEWRALPRNIKKYEPRYALDGGTDGLKYYRALFSQIKKADFQPTVILELDPRRSKKLTTLTRHYFPNATLSLKKDLTGKDRILTIFNEIFRLRRVRRRRIMS